jgi:hypothetical protein
LTIPFEVARRARAGEHVRVIFWLVEGLAGARLGWV